MNHDVVHVELAAASRSDAPLIESLLDDYLRELSTHREVPVGSTDSGSYPYLDYYWTERCRHAFIFRCSGRAVGFALVRDPASTESDVNELAEFYIKPESRRLGIGHRAVRAIWKRFPGNWELQVYLRNSAAVQFWGSCIEAATGQTPQAREVQADDGRRVQFNFVIEHAGRS